MKKANIYLIIIVLLISNGCATKKFIFTSEPEGVLIVGSGKVTGKELVDETITFIGKSDKRSFIAMKRGYYPDTILVSKESPPEVFFDMIKIESFTPLVESIPKLSLDNTIILPVSTDIVLHKGVGNLDKYVRSEELSAKAFLDLNASMVNNHADSTIAVIEIRENTEEAWRIVLSELDNYLKILSPPLLNYYPEPPSIKEMIINKRMQLLSNTLDSVKSLPTKKYIVYGWSKSVKPTAGRIVGNFAAVVASGAVAGYETAIYGAPVSYSDPGAFAIDNSTLFVAYIIDPLSGNIIDIRQQLVPYDITKAERLEQFTDVVLRFPELLDE